MLQTVTNVAFAWPNQADWTVRLQCNDAETGGLIDFSTATVINVAVKDKSGTQVLKASLGSGVTVVSLGLIEFSFAAASMKTLCPGTYDVGGVYKIGTAINQLFVGTLAVIDGIAEA